MPKAFPCQIIKVPKAHMNWAMLMRKNKKFTFPLFLKNIKIPTNRIKMLLGIIKYIESGVSIIDLIAP